LLEIGGEVFGFLRFGCLGFFFFEVRTELDVFSYDGNLGMGFAVTAVPAFLFQAANYPEAPTLSSMVTAAFGKLAPGLHIEKGNLFLGFVPLSKVSVGGDAESTQGRSFCRFPVFRVAGHIPLKEDAVKTIHSSFSYQK
jgi:hypothetical protein